MDLRVEKTYKALVDAFTQLFEEMPIEDISVAQLCDRALVRRTTFYRHFADKDEFVRFYILSLRDEIEARALRGDTEVGPVEYAMLLIREMRAFCLEHERLINNALGGSAFGALYTTLCDVAQRTVLMRIKREEERGAAFAAPAEELALFVSGGAIQTVLTWWLAGHPDDFDDAGLKAIFTRLLLRG